jgi:hypothetical protein
MQAGGSAQAKQGHSIHAAVGFIMTMQVLAALHKRHNAPAAQQQQQLVHTTKVHN